MDKSPSPPSGNARVHKGTDKWFAIGDELASQPPPPNMKTTQEQETIKRTRKLRRTIIIAFSMLPIAIVAVALSVASVRRHLDRTRAAPAVAVADPALAIAAPPPPTASPTPAAAPAPSATPPPSAAIAKPAVTSRVAAAGHPSRAHHKRVRKHAPAR